MQDSLSMDILSEVITYLKYAKYLPEQKRRETWDEIVTRNMFMHLNKYPQFAEEIGKAYQLVYDKKVLPSMRSLQFSGKAIELNPSRIFNCSYAPIDDYFVFAEAIFLLLGGTGFGFSVQKHHVEKLPSIKKPLRKKKRRILIGDTSEGWADSIKILMKSYFFGLPDPVFDFSAIRPKGSLLKTAGGKAPGPDPLMECLFKMRELLEKKEPGDQLKPIEAHDLVCYLSDAVLAGGIRRSSLISFFSIDDEEMLECKSGEWWKDNPQRSRANNSVVLLRHRIKKEEFDVLWKKIQKNGSGEPGIIFSNSAEVLGNPCQPKWATVLTPQGISTIEKIKPGDLIWSGKQFTKVINKWSTGVKKVYEYHTRAGSFYGTENHRIVSGGEKIEVQYAESIDTSQGPASTSFMPTCDKEWNEAQCYVMDGLIIGDGSIHKASGDLIGLHIGENDQDYFKDAVGKLIKEHRPGISKTFYEVQTSIDYIPKTYDRRIPDKYRFAKERTKAMFLRGLYSANGSIVSNRVTLKTASLGLVCDVQEMLSSLGIKSYYTTNKSHEVEFENGTYECKQSYDLNITTDRRLFRAIVGFIQKYKQEKLNKICDEENSRSKRSKTNYEIVSKTFISEEEVFDLTVEAEEHTYWTGGLLVSNCFEISLKPFQMCNLTTINASNIESQEDFNERARVASLIGTLQAGYTNFHYLRDVWRETTEKESLLGVSLTGIASGNVLKLDLHEAAEIVKKENEKVSKLIGINKAARLTCTKPEGTSSLVLSTSSGIHAWHSPYYIRRVRVLKNEPIYTYLKQNLSEFIEDDELKPLRDGIISFPVKSPNGATFRDESALNFLERVKKVSIEWVKNGHRKGDNTHNVSATVSVRENEWNEVGEWMWENRNVYNGLSVIPFSNANYKQMPFEEITEQKYKEMLKYIKKIDLTEIKEEEDNTDLKNEPACSAGGCEVM
mgnify:CR=1 FL=1